MRAPGYGATTNVAMTNWLKVANSQDGHGTTTTVVRATTMAIATTPGHDHDHAHARYHDSYYNHAHDQEVHKQCCDGSRHKHFDKVVADIGCHLGSAFGTEQRVTRFIRRRRCCPDLRKSTYKSKRWHAYVTGSMSMPVRACVPTHRACKMICACLRTCAQVQRSRPPSATLCANTPQCVYILVTLGSAKRVNMRESLRAPPCTSEIR